MYLKDYSRKGLAIAHVKDTERNNFLLETTIIF